MLPPRTPRPFCQPKPSTRSVPSLSVRPIRQAILVVPMSSTPNGPAACGARAVGSGGPVVAAAARGAACRSSVAPPQVGFFGGLAAAACRSGCVRLRPQHQPVGQPQVDRLQAGDRAARGRCCSCSSRSSAATSWPSGSITSVPLFMRRFQRRSPTRTAATTRFCRSPAGRSARRSARAAAAGAPGPTTSGSWRKSATFWLVTDLAVAVDQHELALVLPDRERAALLQSHDDGAGQAPLDGGVLAPRTGSRCAARASFQREAEDRIALADAERRAQQRLGRVGAALDDDVA